MVQAHKNIWLLPHICLQPYAATALNTEQRNKQMCRNKRRIVIAPLPKVLEKYQLVFWWGVFVHLGLFCFFWGGVVRVSASKSNISNFVAFRPFDL